MYKLIGGERPRGGVKNRSLGNYRPSATARTGYGAGAATIRPILSMRTISEIDKRGGAGGPKIVL